MTTTSSAIVEMDDNKREELIRAAIKTAEANGITLTKSTWGIDFVKSKERWAAQKSKCCCALSCLLLAEQDNLKKIINWKSFHLETILDVDHKWLVSFQAGFDGHPKFEDNSYAYELGALIAGEVKPAAQQQLS